KPLSKLVPDLARLRADPRGYLAASPVVIGPRQRHALAAFIGLLCGAAVVAALYVAFKRAPRPNRPDPARLVGMFVSFAAAALVARSLTLRRLAGGTATLRPEGAELEYRGRSLFLPWELFHAEGGQFQ